MYFYSLELIQSSVNWILLGNQVVSPLSAILFLFYVFITNTLKCNKYEALSQKINICLIYLKKIFSRFLWFALPERFLKNLKNNCHIQFIGDLICISYMSSRIIEYLQLKYISAWPVFNPWQICCPATCWQ